MCVIFMNMKACLKKLRSVHVETCDRNHNRAFSGSPVNIRLIVATVPRSSSYFWVKWVRARIFMFNVIAGMTLKYGFDQALGGGRLPSFLLYRV